MGPHARYRKVEDAELRTCHTCGCVTTHWFAYDEEPVREDDREWLCRSRIVCFLCLLKVLVVVERYGRTNDQSQ